MERMRSGASKMLFATQSLAEEGLDIPRLERAFLTTPYRDPVVVQQSIGRIMRPCENKATPIVYDFVDNTGICKSQWLARRRIYKKIGCNIKE